MGDFAELNVRFRLKVETPSTVIDVIKYLTNQVNEIKTIPNHPFFQKERWENVCSFNDDTNISGNTNNFILKRGKWELCVRSVFKDRGEAKLFFDWLEAYIDGHWLSFLGYIKYDVNEHPQLIYYIDDHIKFVRINCDEKEDISKNIVLFEWNIKAE